MAPAAIDALISMLRADTFGDAPLDAGEPPAAAPVPAEVNELPVPLELDCKAPKDVVPPVSPATAGPVPAAPPTPTDMVMGVPGVTEYVPTAKLPDDEP